MPSHDPGRIATATATRTNRGEISADTGHTIARDRAGSPTPDPVGRVDPDPHDCGLASTQFAARSHDRGVVATRLVRAGTAVSDTDQIDARGNVRDGARLAPRVPLELVGRRRDDARLLVAWRSHERLVEARFADLPSFLEAGDVIVVNTSATRPAALVVDDDLVVHLSTELAGGLWSVELRHRCGNGSTPWLDHRPEGPIALPGGGELELLEPYQPAGRAVRAGEPASTGSAGPTSGAPDRSASADAPRNLSSPVRLWTAALRLPRPLDEHLAGHGRPIRYGCDAGGWSLATYQTVFADEPGSAEMPSAARGFTPELVTRLVSKGVIVAPILLHTGVASQEAGEPPYPERYRVSETTAAIVDNAKAAGHRIVAVGTTATRALETVAHPDGTVAAGAGWTDLVITPRRGVHAVDGLITGWHDPEASHLLLVEAVGGPDIIDRSYAAALDAGFAGHEFGDFHLILP